MKSEFDWVSLVVYARIDLGELGAVLVALKIRIGCSRANSQVVSGGEYSRCLRCLKVETC